MSNKLIPAIDRRIRASVEQALFIPNCPDAQFRNLEQIIVNDEGCIILEISDCVEVRPHVYEIGKLYHIPLSKVGTADFYKELGIDSSLLDNQVFNPATHS